MSTNLLQLLSRSPRSWAVPLVAATLMLSACSGGSDERSAPSSEVDASQARLELIQTATRRWSDSSTIAEAHVAAESVLNLVTGPHADAYGDLDGDGKIEGASAIGLLPGEHGEGSLGLPLQGCAGSALLGGSWAEPEARWTLLATAIAEWTSTNNTFPSLPSEAQRVVGWATLTLQTTNLDEAHEFAGHAVQHVEATSQAVDECA